MAELEEEEVTLGELRLKYPKARLHHEPLVTCKRCGGTGEEPPKTLPSGAQMGASPCICVFIQHDAIDLVRDVLREACKSL